MWKARQRQVGQRGVHSQMKKKTNEKGNASVEPERFTFDPRSMETLSVERLTTK